MEAFAHTCSTGAMLHAGTINVVSLEKLNCADRNNACHDIGRKKGVAQVSVSVIHIIPTSAFVARSRYMVRL